jgi:hypothetical protein
LSGIKRLFRRMVMYYNNKLILNDYPNKGHCFKAVLLFGFLFLFQIKIDMLIFRYCARLLKILMKKSTFYFKYNLSQSVVFLHLNVVFSHSVYIYSRWKAKHSGIFSTELRLTFVPHPECDISYIC